MRTALAIIANWKPRTYAELFWIVQNNVAPCNPAQEVSTLGRRDTVISQ
jgi:hypothetical protein